MYEIISKDRRVFVSSSEVLKIKIKYPVFSDCPKINEFYEKISGNALEYCETKLGEWAKSRYECYVSENGGIKGFEKYSYSLICSVCFESDEIAAVKMKASLVEGIRKISVTEHLEVVWWDKRKQLIIAPQKALERICKKQKSFGKIKKASAVFVENGEVFMQKKCEKTRIGEFLPIDDK